MKEKAKKVAQHALNIASPIASTLSLLNPIFLAIPIVSSVANELFSYFDSKSVEHRLNCLQNEIEKESIPLEEFAAKVSELDEHGQYVVRNAVKHVCLSAQPEVVDTINRAIIDLIMREPYGLPEHVCEILQQCNADDIMLLKYIKYFQSNGEKSTYQEKLKAVQQDVTIKGGWRDRSYFYGENNTIFWEDFVKIFPIRDTITDMGIFLNRKFVKKGEAGESNSEIIEFAFLAKSIIKMQSLSVERGSTFGTDFLDCPKSRPLFYPQSLAIQGFCRDKLSVRIWTLKFKQLKIVAEAAKNRRSEPRFPETELLLCPKKCVLILLWRFKVQSGMWAFLIIESDVFVNLLSQFSLRAVSTAVKLLLLKHGKERFHHGVVVRRSCLGKRLRDL